MARYRSSKVSVESFVDVASGVAVRHELDEVNEQVALYFGRDEFVLLLGEEGLRRIVETGDRALRELAAAPEE